MLTLYHCESTRSFRPLWVLEEMGLSYELKVLPFPPRALDKSYLDINPLGTAPAFFDDGTLMTESVAICQYLVTRYGPTPLDVSPTEPAYGDFLNWLHFGEATLTFPQTLVLRYGRFEPKERRLPQVVTDYTRWFLGRLRAVEKVIASRPFISSDRFTVADVSVGYALMLAEKIGIASEFPDVVTEYWQRLQTRSAFQRAIELEWAAGIEQGVETTAFPRPGASRG